MPRFRTDFKAAAENLYPLLHPQQTEMVVTFGPVESCCYVEPHAVIANYQLQCAVCLAQLDPDMLCPCMPHHVGQSLLSYTEAGNREISGYIVEMSHNLGRHAGALLVLVRKLPQGRRQTVRLQHRWTQLEHQATQLSAGMLKEDNALFEARTRGVAR